MAPILEQIKLSPKGSVFLGGAERLKELKSFTSSYPMAVVLDTPENRRKFVELGAVRDRPTFIKRVKDTINDLLFANRRIRSIDIARKWE